MRHGVAQGDQACLRRRPQLWKETFLSANQRQALAAMDTRIQVWAESAQAWRQKIGKRTGGKTTAAMLMYR